VAKAETVDAVEVEVRIAASPETVFDFFTDPALMVQWMGRRVELDPRPGGVFLTEIRDDALASGEYVAVEPPRRVVFTWGWNSEDSVTKPGSTTVEVLLEPDGESGTHLRLIHRDLPSAESAEQHGHGWSDALERLRVAAGNES